MEINPDLAYISYFKNSVHKHDFFKDSSKLDKYK